jgi:trehalose 6-phosphate phosphatase
MLFQDRHSATLAPPRLTPQVALFLDFDGTLTEIASRPNGVQVNGALRGLLSGLQDRLLGAVALLTGRRLAEIDDMLVSPRLSGAGVHGAELRLPRETEVRLQWRPDTRTLLRRLCRHFGGDPRVVVEDKGVAVSLHYRLAPERAGECHRLMHALVPLEDFEISFGRMVVEARPRGANKGRALRAFMQQDPFEGRLPVYVGDDCTDEDGFAAAISLGGFAVKVGTGNTLAPFRCVDVPSVHAWLRDSLGGLATTH